MTERAGSPPIPEDEEQRLESLHALDMLHADSERFDRITRLVQRILGVPIATVTFVDRDVQWHRSKQGLDDQPDTLDREYSFCAHAINHEDVFEVPDATADPRFADNPVVVDDPSVRFYAGAPIHAPDGAQIGRLCALDRQPRKLDPEDVQALNDLAQMADEEILAHSLAITDELTGLANRRGLTVMAGQVLQVAARMSFPVECLFADLDGLKVANDEYGHDLGDRLIKDAAHVLEQTFRGSDVVARLGGDEFCVILTGTASQGGAIAVNRLRDRVARHNEASDSPCDLSLSIGHVGYPADVDVDLEEMLAKADAAMYEDKRARKAGRG